MASAIKIVGLSYHASRPMDLVVEDETGALYWWRKQLELRRIQGAELEPIDPAVYPHVRAASFDKATVQDGETYYDHRVKDYVGRFYGLGTTVFAD